MNTELKDVLVSDATIEARRNYYYKHRKLHKAYVDFKEIGEYGIGFILLITMLPAMKILHNIFFTSTVVTFFIWLFLSIPVYFIAMKLVEYINTSYNNYVTKCNKEISEENKELQKVLGIYPDYLD